VSLTDDFRPVRCEVSVASVFLFFPRFDQKIYGWGLGFSDLVHSVYAKVVAIDPIRYVCSGRSSLDFD